MRYEPKAIADINVTPFVDVMLVLLIIFMVTAPLMQQGIDVELPKTQASGLPTDTEPLIIAVKRDGTIFVQETKVKSKALESKLKKILESRGEGEVFLRADARVNYGTVARILAILRRAGATRIGMVTEPEA